MCLLLTVHKYDTIQRKTVQFYTAVVPSAVCKLMPSSHRRHQQDKTVLSCLVLLASAVWTELATSQDCRRLKISKQFCPVSKCGVNWVLSCPDPVSNAVTYCTVIFGNWVKTSSQMRSHRRRDWTKLFSLQYIEDYWKLSATVAKSVHTADADETRQFCLVGVGGVN